MNSRQRFLAVLHGETPDFPPLFPEGIRAEVLDAWQNQGLAPGADLSTIFDYDPFEELDPDVYPAPEIADWSTPDRLLPLLRRSLDPADPRRLPPGWLSSLQRWRSRTYPLFLRIHQGLFLSLGIDDFRSFAPALLRLVDQPAFVHQIMEIQADFAACLLPTVLEYPFNALWLCETPPGELTIPQVRAITGPGITLIGGIDSDVLRQNKLEGKNPRAAIAGAV